MDMQDEVALVFDSYSPKVKAALLQIRQWIFEHAQANGQIGELSECLKWNEPSYLTLSTKSGTTLRLAQLNEASFALLVHCQTRVISEFKILYPQLSYDKNRAVIFKTGDQLPREIIQHFIHLALSYHLWK